VPELRREMLYERFFLSDRTARFDAAVLGLILAAAARRPVLAAVAIPYARRLASDPGGPFAGVAADAVGLAALMVGSVRYRSLLA